MSEKAKRKGIEIGAGLLAYVIVWAIEFYANLGRQEAALLFLVPYVVLSATTYVEQIKNPYHFRVGKTEVRVSYSDTGDTLDDCFERMLSSISPV